MAAASGGGGGSVTSVALAVPSGLTVTGSPVTGSGTITVATSLSGIVKGTGTGFTTATAGTDYVTPSGLAGKADDSLVVHLAGNETITGTKTFSGGIVGNLTGVASSATTAAALTGTITESQVSGLVTDLSGKASDSLVVHLAGSETITGTKTFSNAIVGNLTGTASSATTAAALSTTLDVAHGGTGQTSASAAINALVPTQTSNSGKVLGTDGTAVSWVAAGSGGGGTPGGSSGQIQYNSSGAFAGSSAITTDLANGNCLVLTQNNGDPFGDSAGSNAHLMLNNPTGSQTFIECVIGGSMRSKWRSDSQGNTNWIATHAHVFYIGADANAGIPAMRIMPNGRVGIGEGVDQNSGDPGASLHVVSNNGYPAIAVSGLVGQSVDLFESKDSSGNVLARIDAVGGIGPVHLADSAAQNDSIYYSTTAGRMAYKDSSGSVVSLGGASGSATLAVATITAAYTLVSGTDQYIRADASAGAFTLTLPTAVGVTGQVFYIKKIDATTNAITVATTSAQTIDGGGASITTQYASMTIVSNGSNWEVI